MDKVVSINEIWAQYGLVGLCMLGLFVLIIIDKLLIKSMIDKLPELIRRLVISSLFDIGIIPDRRKKQVPVDQDKREN